MCYDFRIRMDKETRESVIDLKCLNCDHEEAMPMDVFSELFDSCIGESPAFTCLCCDPDSLVPKDAYEQIRGGFAYKR